MRKFQNQTQSTGLFAASEKRKLIVMTVGLVLLVVAFGISRYKEGQYRDRDDGVIGGGPIEFSERVELPEIDVAALEAMVSDGSPADRVLLEREALEHLFETARNLGPAHFAAMDTREIDAGVASALLDDPSAARGDPFTARGWIVSLRRRNPGSGRPAQWQGRLVLEDESSVYFVVKDLAEGIRTEPGADEFVRIDGLFLKAFNDEDPEQPGSWIQGPLLVGPEALRSYTSLGPIEELPFGAFADVTDDDLREGFSGVPHRPLWTLMAYARDRAEGSVDWEAAPELGQPEVTEMMVDGSRWRAQPFRLGPSQLMGFWVQRPGENAARMEEVTEGWIGNWNWTGEAKVLRFVMPGARRDLAEGDLVQGRGFFLKNHAYEPRDGGLRLASYVVIDDLEEFVPPDDRSIQQLWAVVIAMVVGLGGLLFFLVVRDRKRSNRIQETLAQRRRDRRRLRVEGEGVPQPAPPTSP